MLDGAVRSKTIWVGILGLVVSVGAVLEPHLNEILKPYLDPATVAAVGSTFSVIMMILRTLTTTSLAEKGGQKGEEK